MGWRGNPLETTGAMNDIIEFHAWMKHLRLFR